MTNGWKVVMIASAAVGEGKTLTAANLALTLTESYHRRVLLIDADLRRPSLHVLFGLNNASGLSDGLSSQGRTFPVQQLSARLSILTTGRLSADPMAELTSDAMKRLVHYARDAYDWVVIDTPPIGLLPDASLLAAMADATVMVVRAESTPYDLITKAADAVGRQKIAGIVLNRARQTPSGNYRYYDDTSRPGD
jgi:capsular exopolysaccharide synthesis family protein